MTINGIGSQGPMNAPSAAAPGTPLNKRTAAVAAVALTTPAQNTGKKVKVSPVPNPPAPTHFASSLLALPKWKVDAIGNKHEHTLVKDEVPNSVRKKSEKIRKHYKDKEFSRKRKTVVTKAVVSPFKTPNGTKIEFQGNGRYKVGGRFFGEHRGFDQSGDEFAGLYPIAAGPKDPDIVQFKKGTSREPKDLTRKVTRARLAFDPPADLSAALKKI